MPTCGHCRAEGQTIDHIRECSKSSVDVLNKPSSATALSGFATNYVDSASFQPMAFSGVLPDSYYALDTSAGLHFYRAKTGKGKWAGFQFVDRLIGHPGDFLRTPVKGASRKAVLNLIGQDAKASAILFSREFTVCAACGSPLTDEVSMEIGLGPVCREKF